MMNIQVRIISNKNIITQ